MRAVVKALQVQQFAEIQVNEGGVRRSADKRKPLSLLLGKVIRNNLRCCHRCGFSRSGPDYKVPRWVEENEDQTMKRVQTRGIARTAALIGGLHTSPGVAVGHRADLAFDPF